MRKCYLRLFTLECLGAQAVSNLLVWFSLQFFFFSANLISVVSFCYELAQAAEQYSIVMLLNWFGWTLLICNFLQAVNLKSSEILDHPNVVVSFYHSVTVKNIQSNYCLLFTYMFIRLIFINKPDSQWWTPSRSSWNSGNFDCGLRSRKVAACTDLGSM